MSYLSRHAPFFPLYVSGFSLGDGGGGFGMVLGGVAALAAIGAGLGKG